MARTKLDKYFKDKQERYDASYMIKILEDMLGKSFEEIKNYIETAKIEVTYEQITEFLDRKLLEEDPELKKRMEDRKKAANGYHGIVDLVNVTEEEIDEAANYFGDQLAADRYTYYPYTTTYFERYTDIVRSKARKLLNIIEKLANKDTESIEKILKDLDVNVDKDGKISKVDLCRLVIPTIANTKMLEQKLKEANNLETYLTFKLSIDLIYRRGNSEDEYYPSRSLQYFGDLMYYHEDYVELSQNQKDEKERIRRENSRHIAKWLTKLD